MVDFLRGLPFLLRSREKKLTRKERQGRRPALTCKVIVVISSQTVTVPIWLHEYCGFVAAQTVIACDLFNRKKTFARHETASRRTGYLRGSPPLVPPAGAAFPPPVIVAVVRWCLHRLRPHHPSIPTTTSAPTIASMLRPPRLNYRLHLEPGAHTLAFDTSVTHLILAVIHAPVAAKSIYQAGWISKRVFFRASFCMKRWFGRETYGHLSFIVYWLCSVSSAFRILRSPLMSPFFPLVILYFYSQAFFNTWFCFVI